MELSQAGRRVCAEVLGEALYLKEVPQGRREVDLAQELGPEELGEGLEAGIAADAVGPLAQVHQQVPYPGPPRHPVQRAGRLGQGGHVLGGRTEHRGDQWRRKCLDYPLLEGDAVQEGRIHASQITVHQQGAEEIRPADGPYRILDDLKPGAAHGFRPGVPVEGDDPQVPLQAAEREAGAPVQAALAAHQLIREERGDVVDLPFDQYLAEVRRAAPDAHPGFAREDLHQGDELGLGDPGLDGEALERVPFEVLVELGDEQGTHALPQQRGQVHGFQQDPLDENHGVIGRGHADEAQLEPILHEPAELGIKASPRLAGLGVVRLVVAHLGHGLDHVHDELRQVHPELLLLVRRGGFGPGG